MAVEPMKQLNIEDNDGVLHQFEVKDEKARNDIASAKTLDFNNNQFKIDETQSTVGITVQANNANSGNYLRGDGTWYDLSGVMDENFENTYDYINEVSSWVPSLNEENDYLKVSLTRDGETLSGGMIGGHNINVENAGKILRINTEGTDLELIRFTGGLAYNAIDSSEWPRDVTVDVELNVFNDCGVIPAGVRNINFLFDKPIDPEAMPNGIIHFELPVDAELLDVNVFYKVNDGEYEECNYSFLNRKDYKYPIYFNPKHIYQITLNNHNAAFFDFSDNVHEKKNFIQLWYLDPNSLILHHFPTDDPEVFNITSGSPYDEAGFGNDLYQIDFSEKFGYYVGTENAGLTNWIDRIVRTTIFRKTEMSASAGFGNDLYGINKTDKYQYYSDSTDSYSMTNELIDLNKTVEFKYLTTPISSTYSVNNELINLTITQEEIEGYTREG